MINDRFKQRKSAFIAAIKAKSDISHFKGTRGEPATWDDVAWFYVDKNGLRNNYYFTQNVVKDFINTDSCVQLSQEKKYLLMAYTLHSQSGKTSMGNKFQKISAARNFLSFVGEIDDISTETVAEFQYNDLCSGNVFYLVKVFIEWLIKSKLIRPEITFNEYTVPLKTGDEASLANKEKLPEEKVLIALGAINYDTISINESNWKLHALDPQRDALVCAMTALAMGSPNRVGAEQTVLSSQLLHHHSQIVNGVEKTVHYLNWRGSKGYKDYNNHILAGMTPVVERSLIYIQRATEPARILARFYTNPKAPLKDILLKFKPSKKNLKLLNLDMNKPIHMLALGMLIGFYDGTDKCVQVLKFTEGAEKSRYSQYWPKHIKALKLDDVISMGTAKACKKLLNVGFCAKQIKMIFSNRRLTVSELQNKWIAHVTSKSPNFPVLSNNTKHGEVDMRTAMFAFTGNQFYRTKTGHSGALSFYFLVPPITVSRAVYQDLRKHLKIPNIFSRYGFSNDFHISLHQFRHYLNDCAERNGIPRQIINLWSGRVNPDQIVHYVHRTGAERANEISDILWAENDVSESEAAKSIRLISKDEYDQLTDGVATETSSGICVQQLIYNPCTYLNDFDTQCALCSSSYHVAHDENAIALLEKDLTVQKQRMEDVQERQKFPHSQAMQGWFQTHYKNTEALDQLVTLMKAPDIKKGSLIRLVSQKNEFRITDLERKTVNIHSLKLVDADQALQLALDLKTPKPESEFENLLGMI
jgi:hypothetical protein